MRHTAHGADLSKMCARGQVRQEAVFRPQLAQGTVVDQQLVLGLHGGDDGIMGEQHPLFRAIHTCQWQSLVCYKHSGRHEAEHGAAVSPARDWTDGQQL